MRKKIIGENKKEKIIKQRNKRNLSGQNGIFIAWRLVV
jgi:hypothetical protein